MTPSELHATDSGAVASAAESVGHFVCAYCYPNADVPAASFCGSTRPPRRTRMSGEHLTKCPMCWAVFDRGGFCEHYHAPRGGRP